MIPIRYQNRNTEESIAYVAYVYKTQSLLCTRVKFSVRHSFTQTTSNMLCSSNGHWHVHCSIRSHSRRIAHNRLVGAVLMLIKLNNNGL